MQTKIKRRIRLLLKTVVAVLAIAIVSGLIYEEIGRRNDRKRNPQIGQSIDIGGRSLNIYFFGGGRAAVVFDSSAGAPGSSLSDIQPQNVKFTPAGWVDGPAEGVHDDGPLLPTPS